MYNSEYNSIISRTSNIDLYYSLTNKNIIDMMNNINNVKRKSMGFKTPYELFENIYGEEYKKTSSKTHIK